MAEARARLLEAALPHVPFDGWSDTCFNAALSDSGVDEALARLALPRGALDLALAYHDRGDQAMLKALGETDLTTLRYSDRVALAVRLRLEADTDREAVRRGLTFFAAPAHAAEGAAAIWRTSDLIWKALGDTSEDLNWYSKRAVLSAVYSSTLLFWLGDESDGHQATWEFLARRIGNVGQFEKFKGQVRKSPLYEGFMRGPGKFLDRIHAPRPGDKQNLPGYVSPKD